MNKLRSLLRKLIKSKDFYLKVRHIGVLYAIRYELISIFKDDRYLQSVVYNHLKDCFADDLLTGELTKGSSIEPMTDESPIWVCWWQGEDKMPSTVRLCYNSIVKQANGRNVQFITLDNYQSFVTIPDYIVEKVNNRYISLTHFSDILRFSLLAEYGGLWIDITMFVTAPIDMSNKFLYSLKQKHKDDKYVSNYRWTTFCIGGGRNNPLFLGVKRIFFDYFKLKTVFPDYLFLDCIMALLYDSNEDIKSMVDAIPVGHPDVNLLQSMLDDKFNQDKYDELMSDNHFHKLTWKKTFKDVDEDGDKTFYGYIKQL